MLTSFVWNKKSFKLVHFKKIFSKWCLGTSVRIFEKIQPNRTTFYYKQIKWVSTQSKKCLFWTDYNEKNVRVNLKRILTEFTQNDNLLRITLKTKPFLCHLYSKSISTKNCTHLYCKHAFRLTGEIMESLYSCIRG